MKFEDKIKEINKNEIKDFLESMPVPCYESKILKIAFNNFNIHRSNSLTLYQNHFALFHILYLLQEEYYKINKYLHVHFMRIFLLNYPDLGKCRYYNDDLSLFCNNNCEKSEYYCNFHLNKINDNKLDILSEKYFYMDKNNFYNINEKNADAFINGTWEILYNHEKMQKSFKILDLPTNAGIDLIKKQYKKLAKKYHPDLNYTNDKKFNEINNAYQFLIQILNLKIHNNK